MAKLVHFNNKETFYLNGNPHLGVVGTRNEFFKELEYLESNVLASGAVGGSYIDTKWIPNYFHDIDVKMTVAIPTATSGKRTILLSNYGVESINSSQILQHQTIYSLGIEIYSDRKVRLWVDNGSVNIFSNTPLAVETPYTLHYTYDSNTFTHIIHVESLDRTTTNFTMSAIVKPKNIEQPMWMFRDGRKSGIPNYSIRIYQMEINNGDVHKKFIPCLNRDNTAGMYELVEQSFYRNKDARAPFTLGKAFTEVEWLKSNNGSVIDTLIVPDNNSGMRVLARDFEMPSNDFNFIGCRTSTNRFAINMWNKNCFTFGFGVWTSIEGASYVADTLYDLRLNWYNEKKFRVNEKSYDITTEITDTLPGSAMVFTQRLPDDSWSNFDYYIHAYSLTQGNELLRDMIPVKDADSVGALFDKVTHTLFYNIANVGNFTCGDEIHYVDYLESTGTQYVDLGVYGTEDLETELVCQQLQINTEGEGKAIFGAFESASANCYYLYQQGAGVGPSAWQAGFGNFQSTSSLVDTNKHTFLLSNYKLYMDGVELASFNSGSMTTTYHTLLAFNMHRSDGTTYNTLPQRFWKIKLKKGGEVIRDFVPVMNENKVGKMLDINTHKLYANAGTGNFSIGCQRFQPYEEENELPNGYLRLKYLEAAGGQIIDTLYTPTTSTGINITYSYPDTEYGSGAVCGTYQNTAPRTDTLAVFTSTGAKTGTVYMMHRGVSFNTTQEIVAGDWYNCKSNWLNSGKFNFNEGVKTGNVGSNEIDTHTILIFGIYLKRSETISYGYVRIKDCQISEGNNIVRHYVPALRLSDKKPGMYDLITKEFLTTPTATDFTYEFEDEYMRLNYIQTDGNQYIDTGYIPNDNTIIEYDFEPLSVTTSRFFCGVWGAANSSIARLYLYNSGTACAIQYGFGSGGGSDWKNYSSSFTLERHKVIMERTQLTLDGTVILSGLTGSNADKENTFWVGKCNDTSGRYSDPSKIYGCSIIENNTKLKNLIPVLRLKDNKPGLFDMVSGNFLTNSGTGEFIYG